MANASELLNTGLGIIGREMTRLEKASLDEERMGLTGPQREDLCAYMGVLQKLIGKNVDDESLAEMSEEELLKQMEEMGFGVTGKGKGKDKRW